MIEFSDLHLEPKSADTALEVLERVPDVARERGDNHVAFLGDFWMVRHQLPVKLMLRARSIIRGWRERGVERFDVLPGNHDQVDLEGRNALEVFDGLGDFVHVHTEPTWTDDGFWLPYRHSHEEIRALLTKAAERVKRGAPAVLFAHMGLMGAWMNNLKRDDTGFSASEIVDLGFKRVFCGHYHRHNTVMKGVQYVGSPYQVSYAEADQQKGVVSWRDGKSEFIPLEIGPRHFKVVFDADHPAPLELPPVKPSDKLWVVVKGQMAGAAQKTVQDNLKAIGLEPARIEIDLQPVDKAARISVSPDEPRAALAARYVGAQDVPDEYKAMLLETFNRVVTP